jgi:hypothetical protein
MTVEPDVHVSTRQLDHQAIEALLAKHHVGSTAIAFHDRVNIALANYVYTDRHIYGRLEDGPDVATVRHRHWVAFQVSEIAGIYYWRTVTANGSIPGLTDGPSVGEATEYRKALASCRPCLRRATRCRSGCTCFACTSMTSLVVKRERTRAPSAPYEPATSMDLSQAKRQRSLGSSSLMWAQPVA